MKNNKVIFTGMVEKNQGVYSRHYNRNGNITHHPYIRLAGKYLENIGFNIGDRINIQIEQGKITITKIDS